MRSYHVLQHLHILLTQYIMFGTVFNRIMTDVV